MANQHKTVIDRAIDLLGGPSKAAASLNVSNPSVIINWRYRQSIPAQRVLEIESLTGISRHELRPDVFGSAP
jgi:DNA-binding transcriptional regulator YdaS (Cro superfamily)